MTSETKPDEQLDVAEFERRLQQLIDDARTAGLDLTGGYTATDTDAAVWDYTVEITKLVNQSPSKTHDTAEK